MVEGAYRIGGIRILAYRMDLYGKTELPTVTQYMNETNFVDPTISLPTVLVQPLDGGNGVALQFEGGRIFANGNGRKFSV